MYDYGPMECIDERILHIRNKPKPDESKVNATLSNWFGRKKAFSEQDCTTILQQHGVNSLEFALCVDSEYTSHTSPLPQEYAPTQLIEASARSEKGGTLDFAYLIRPFLAIFRSQMNAVNLKHGKLLSDEAINNVLSYLTSSLLSKSLKTFIYDMHLSKMKTPLVGATGSARLQNYLANVGTSEGLLDFYKRYPVLYRKNAETSKRTITYIDEMLTRLIEERGTISAQLLHSDVAFSSITKVDLGQGDTHNGGQTVAIINTNIGKIVYKPRNISIETAYRNIVEFFSRAIGFLDLYIPKSTLSSQHAFVEYIEHKTCQNETEIKQYFKRYGEIVALMYLCNGTDMHYENIIAHGPYPVVIDIETLFCTPIVTEKHDTTSPSSLQNPLRDSVASSIMLPLKTAFQPNGTPIDLSGLSMEDIKVRDGAFLPTALTTDDAHFEKADAVISAAANRVTLNNQTVNPKNYVEDIVQGFNIVVKFFLANKSAFVDLVKCLPNYQIRVLARDTHRYARLLSYSQHPSCMSDYLKCEKVLENLYAYPFENKAIARCEYNDMLFDDVPLFIASIDSPNITGNGHTISNGLVDSPKSYLITKLNHIDDESLSRQVSIIRMACLGRKAFVPHRLTFRSKHSSSDIEMQHQTASSYSSMRVLSEMTSCAHFNGDDSHTLISLPHVKENEEGDCVPTLMPIDFYDGYAGMAQFAIAANSIQPDSNSKHLSTFAFKAIDACATMPTAEGYYIGTASVFRLMTHGLLPRETLSHLQSLFLKNLNMTIAPYEEGKVSKFDYLDGSTGFIKLLCDLSLYYADSIYIEKAERLARVLLNGFNSSQTFSNCGIGHGIAGCQIALCDLYGATNDKTYLREIDSLQHRLADLAAKSTSATWCNGYLGALLSQSYLLSKNVIARLPDWFNDCERRLSNYRFKSQCVCHGDCGRIQYYLDRYVLEANYDCLLIASDLASELQRSIVDAETIEIDELPTFPNIGLFTGLSGIGYTLLRSSHPDLPSILL